MTSDFKVIVIGASAGGTQALIDLTKNLPEDLSAAVFIVQHMPPKPPSNLARILKYRCSLPIIPAVDGAIIEPGTIYIAVADNHLMLENDQIVVTKGPKENRFRPSVDALFRSAAYYYRNRVIGVVLSGALNDGTSGMWAIKRFSGLSLIQCRDEALFDGMPSSVAEYVEVDYELEIEEMGSLLGKLAQKNTGMHKSDNPDARTERFVEAEMNIAKGGNALKNGVLDHGEFSPLTCPDCHGALTEYKEGKLRRFRCHTGHAHTSDTLITGIDENIEKSMWEVMRGLEESQLLLNHMAEVSAQSGNATEARDYQNRAGKLAESAQMVKKAILKQSLRQAG